MIETLPFKPATIADLQAEMNRAVRKHGWEQTPLNSEMADGVKLSVLVEEVGEVARAMTYDEGSREQLAAELLQTAAMALAWHQAVAGE